MKVLASQKSPRSKHATALVSRCHVDGSPILELEAGEEDATMSDGQPQRPTSNDDRDGWTAYWASQGMSWRTEPGLTGNAGCTWPRGAPNE